MRHDWSKFDNSMEKSLLFSKDRKKLIFQSRKWLFLRAGEGNQQEGGGRGEASIFIKIYSMFRNTDDVTSLA